MSGYPVLKTIPPIGGFFLFVWHFLSFHYCFFMLEFILRENMKLFSRFLLIALAMVSMDAMAQPIPQTAGSNLTAWNGGSGATNNNNWNSLMNNRSGSVIDSAPAADFGNCNALILRCAQPKCATGGCTTMDITVPIVTGCVMDNETCKKHGDQLIQTISAQLVANSNAKVQQAQLEAQHAAAQAAAAQSSQQMQQMQAQMQQTAQPQAAANAWTCACGHAGNTGKFCSECGKAKPELWTCPICGEIGNKGKFCSECGAAKPESWDCPQCGATGNKGKFCSECGMKKEGNA